MVFGIENEVQQGNCSFSIADRRVLSHERKTHREICDMMETCKCFSS